MGWFILFTRAHYSFKVHGQAESFQHFLMDMLIKDLSIQTNSRFRATPKKSLISYLKVYN